MHRIDHSTAAAGIPSPDSPGTPGFFTKGDPQIPVPATVVTADWANAAQEELAFVIEQGGFALSKTDNTQLRQAIVKLVSDAAKSVRIDNATFGAGVVDGEIVRWDSGAGNFVDAIADGSANNRAVGVADVTNSKVYAFGETPALFSGLTPGARYFLSAVTAGAITAAVPSDQVAVGIAKSATTLFVDIDAGLQILVKPLVKDHGTKSANYTLQLDEAELHLVAFSAAATLTIASTLTNDKATVVIKNGGNAITLAGIDNDPPILTNAVSKQDFVGLVKSFGKISAVAVVINKSTA
jgi:hypothetical protein